MNALHTLLMRPQVASTARRVSPSLSAQRTALLLAAALPLLLLLLVAMPWQQTALGTGRVIAFAPEDRQQSIEAPLTGRIERWLVQEGEVVEAGQPLVEILDVDPLRMERLKLGQQAANDQMQSVEDQIRSYEAKMLAEMSSRDLAVAEAQAKVRGLEQKRVGDLAEAEIETLNAARLETLSLEGIASQRDAEVARMKRDQAKAALLARDREIEAQRQALEKVRADAEAKIASAQADLEAARAKLTESTQKLVDAETRVARQQAQLVRAPRDGVVLRLHGGPGGSLAKEGDVLVTLVPEANAHAVELWVDGNDLPLLRAGQEVRLLFEGWPAVQLPGWPGASEGTFAGRLLFIDATDDGKGRFRAVVLPDEDSSDWPDPSRLRQGVRAKGFVLLGRVRLGYELWRRMNGFPPLPTIEKGDTTLPASQKKPRIPGELK